MFILTIYLSHKKFKFEAEKEKLFNSFFEQLYSSSVCYIQFGNVIFNKNEFRLATITEKRRLFK